MALASLLRLGQRDLPADLMAAEASPHGMALTQVADLASRAGLRLKAIRRAPGSAIPTPSVVHWKLDHYSAILQRREHNGQEMFLVENPLFEDRPA